MKHLVTINIAKGSPFCIRLPHIDTRNVQFEIISDSVVRYLNWINAHYLSMLSR